MAESEYKQRQNFAPANGDITTSPENERTAAISNPLSLTEIHQATAELRKQSLPPDMLDTLASRISATYTIAEEQRNPELEKETSLLEHRMQLTQQAKFSPRIWTPEAIEQSVTNLRQQLEKPPTTDARSRLFEKARETRKERGQPEFTVEQAPPSEQVRFINFIHARLLAGMVDFTPNGIPSEKQLHDAIMLFYQPEKAKEKGIAETPKGTPTEEATSLNEDQQYYLDSLLERTMIAAGHQGNILPPETSMHMVVRKLSRGMKQGTHFDPEFVWALKDKRPPSRNPRPM